MNKSVPKFLKLPALDNDPLTYEMYMTTKELAARWRMNPGSLANQRSLGRQGPAYIRVNDNTVLYPMSEILAYEREHLIATKKKQRKASDLSDL